MYTLDKPQKIDKSFAITSIVEKAAIGQNDMANTDEKYIEVSGYASRMYIDGDYVIDADGENVNTFGFDLKRLQNGIMPLLYNHKQSDAVGKVTSATYDKDGLLITAKLYKLPGDTLTNYVYEAVKAGIISSFSVGMLVKDFDVISQDGEDYLQLSKSEVIEVSLVPVPSNPEALFRMTSIKSIDGTEKSVTLLEKSVFKQENSDVCNGFECAMKTQKETEMQIKEVTEEKEVVLGITEPALDKLDEIVNPPVEDTPVEQPQIDEVVVPDAVEAVTDTSNDKPSDEPKDDLKAEENKVEEATPVATVTLNDSLETIGKLDVANMTFDELEQIYEVLTTMAEKIEETIAPEVIQMAQEALLTVTAPAA